jgi:uncharacterized protein (DUF1697 family)
MSIYISLLRGINVGGQNRLPMDGLREMLAEMGFIDIRTYVQSGNVVFRADDADPEELSRRIEKRIQQAYAYSVAVFTRQPQDLQRILANNPFLIGRQEDPARLHVTFLYREPDADAWSKTIAPPGIMDEFARGVQEVYIFCPNGYGKTKLSNDFFERKLGVQATTRNWNTVNTLYQMVEG